jgi:SAM-dependent methyltransferase
VNWQSASVIARSELFLIFDRKNCITVSPKILSNVSSAAMRADLFMNCLIGILLTSALSGVRCIREPHGFSIRGNVMNEGLLNLTRLTIARFVPASIKRSSAYLRLRDFVLGHDAIYNAEYYARDVEGPAVESAGTISNTITSYFKPKSLIDVGCGTGALLSAFREQGLFVTGLEYSEAGLEYCRRRGLTVTKFDIERDDLGSVLKGQKYDVCISLEVAEHLPKSVAKRYVALLSGLSPTVVISAAHPGQGGVDHVNEQPKSYWIEKFAKCGHIYDETATRNLTHAWSSNAIEPFYYENLMVFRGGA